MNLYILSASIITIVVGLIHSALGEKLIFSKLRKKQIIPTKATAPLQERHIRIIWASWHVLTILAFGIALILFWLSLPSTNVTINVHLKFSIVGSMLLSAILVCFATKAKHPGWVGLLAVAILVWLG